MSNMALEDSAHTAFGSARTTMYISDVDQVTEVIRQVVHGERKLTVIHGAATPTSFLIISFSLYTPPPHTPCDVLYTPCDVLNFGHMLVGC